MSAWKPSKKTFSFRKFPQSWICSHFNKVSVKRYFWNRNILYSITQIHKVRKFNGRDKAAKECRQWQGHIRSWGMRVTRSNVKRSETPNTTGTVLSVKVVPKVFRGNRWAKCLKSLHLLRSGSVSARSSQKRLTRGESAIPLGDTDAHETWSVGPGGDDGGGRPSGGRVRAEQLAQKVSWQRLSQHWLLPKNYRGKPLQVCRLVCLSVFVCVGGLCWEKAGQRAYRVMVGEQVEQ